jgi:hypothetical protein
MKQDLLTQFGASQEAEADRVINTLIGMGDQFEL